MPQIRKAIHPKQAALWRALQAQATMASDKFQAVANTIMVGHDVDAPEGAQVVLDAEKPELVWSWPDGTPSEG